MPRLSSINSAILSNIVSKVGNAIDSLWGNVVFMLNGEMTTLTDISPQPNVITGTAVVNTTSARYGTNGIQFGAGGASTSLTVDQTATTVALWNNNFTFECWFNIASFTPTSGNGLQGLFCVGDYVSGILFRLSATYGIELYCLGTPVNNQVNITTGAWHHIALVRNNTVMTVFYDGNPCTNTFNVSGYNFPALVITIGKAYHNPSVEYFYGYMDDIRLTNGVARYTTAFVPTQLPFSGVTPDPLFSDVGLLLTGETLLDSSSTPKILSAFGTPAVSTSVKKYRTGSIYFNGSSSLSYANSLTELTLDQNFTIEMWLYITDVSSGYHRIFQNQQGSNTATGFFYVYNNGTNIIVYNTTIGTLVSVGSFTANAWFHLGIVKYDSTFKVFINGVNSYSMTSMTTTVTSAGFVIGGGAIEPMTGYISDLRITKGVARYVSNFTPPTTALSLINTPKVDIYSNLVVVLLKGNGTNGTSTFIDASPSARTITNTGSPVYSSSVYRYGGSSMSLPASSGISFPKPTFGSNDFTIEFWAYRTGTASWIGLMGSWPNPGTNATNSWGIGTGGSGNEMWMGFFSSSSSYAEVQGSTWPLNAWVHVAVVRIGSTITMYRNGVAVLTLASFTTAVYAGTHPVVNIGTAVGYYINNFRITIGVGRYTGTFTPPGLI